MTWIAMFWMERCGSIRRRLKARCLRLGVGFLAGFAVLTTVASSGAGGGTCEVFIAIDYPELENSCVPLGQPLTVELKIWTGAITGGSKVTIEAIHFSLDCSVPGLSPLFGPCKDDGAVVGYGGDATIAHDCGPVFLSMHPIGASPNEVVFVANQPFDIYANTGTFSVPACSLSFQTELLGFSNDSTPAIVTQLAVISPDDAECDNGVPAAARSLNSVQICSLVDVGIVLEPILRLPIEAFKTAALRRVMVNILDEVGRLVAAVKLTAAVEGLQNLVRHVDGCGSVPDGNDWIVDCESQTAVRDLLIGLIDTLDRFIDGRR